MAGYRAGGGTRHVSATANGDADPSFHLRTIGPEPAGATPLEEEDLEVLIPTFVATRADLNLVELENIVQALPWARTHAQMGGPDAVLDYSFMLTLHRRMFGDVWRWAGTQRRRLTNIGVAPELITTQSRSLFDDALYWHRQSVFDPDERAIRIHARLVHAHPFPNGNGRCTRLIADLYLHAIAVEPFSWGASNLDIDGSARQSYIAALVKAIDTDDYADLLRFARG